MELHVHVLFGRLNFQNFTQVQSLREEEFTERGLKEDQPYNFRVAAENEVGVGEYAELPKAVVPKSQYGKLLPNYRGVLTES